MTTEFIWALCSHRAGDGSQVNQKVPDRPATLDYLAEVTSAAEESGFANILVPCGTHCIDAWNVASAVAAKTKKIKFLVAFRPGITGPVYAAQQANSLDYLTDGRCTLNIVTGSTPVDQKRYGDPLPHEDRYKRTEEFLEIVTSLWKNKDPLDYDGNFFSVENCSIFPDRKTIPNPPIYLAGSSDPGKKIAARYADVHMMYAAEPNTLFTDIEEVTKLSEEYERHSPIEFGIRHLVCVRETKEEARKAAEALIDKSELKNTGFWFDMKNNTESVGQKRINEMGSRDNLWLTDTMWMGVNRVRGGAGTMFVGTPDMVASTIREYYDIGIRHFIMNGWPHKEEAEIFGREVLPLLKDMDPVVL